MAYNVIQKSIRPSSTIPFFMYSNEHMNAINDIKRIMADKIIEFKNTTEEGNIKTYIRSFIDEAAYQEFLSYVDANPIIINSRKDRKTYEEINGIVTENTFETI